MNDFDSRFARRRALRAARAVTFSASLVGLAACGGGTDTGDAFSAPDAPSGATDAFAVMDAPAASDDAASASDDAATTGDAARAGDAATTDDAFASADDAGVSDDAYTFTGDAGCGPDFPPTNQPCCELVGGFWDEASAFCAIAVPGPFVPPAMVG